MKHNHKNGTGNPERNPWNWKDGIEMFSWIATVGVFIFSIYVACRQESMLDTEERAWINIDNIGIAGAYSPNSHIGVEIQYENTGKTPAIIDNVEIIMGVSHTPFTVTNWNEDVKIPGGMCIAPGKRAPGVWHETNQITEGEFVLLNEKQSKHFFIWKVTYRDAFSNVRHTDMQIVLTGTIQEMTTVGAVLQGIYTLRMD